MKKILVTHNGVFHADEVMATSVLLNLYEEDNVVIVRTSINKIDKYINDENAIIYDIGNGKYDHHTRTIKRNNGIPYSSIGLIWKDFGKDLINKRAIRMGINDLNIVNRVFNIIDTILIQGIDANDNGYKSPDVKESINYFTISNMVFTFNTISYDGGVKNVLKQELNFKKAVDICSQILIALIRKYIDGANSEAILQELIRTRKNKRILVLDKFIPWIGYITKNVDDIWYVIFPSTREEGEWNMQAVPANISTSTSIKVLRHPVPQVWWGKDTKSEVTLAEVTGVEEATFCYKGNGFLTAAKGLDAILKLANMAVEEKSNINEMR